MKMLKLFSITFAVMGVIQLPALVCMIMGLGDGEAADLSITTLANLPELDSLGNHVMVYWGSMDQRKIFVMLSYLDCLAISFFMVVVLILIHKQKGGEINKRSNNSAVLTRQLSLSYACRRV